MLTTLKVQGKKYAFDTTCGALIPVSALQFKMLAAIIPPLTPVCPTSLRYELAKYDSGDVSDAYDELYAMKEKGLLYGEESGKILFMTDGEFGCSDEAIVGEVLNSVFETVPDGMIFEAKGSGAGKVTELAKTISAQFGKKIL